MKNWRLTSEVIVFVSSSAKNVDKIIYLAAPGKSKYQNLIKRILPDKGISFKELTILNNKFQLKLGSDLRVYVKSEKLPDMNSWYLVGNPVTNKTIGDILSSQDNNKGVFINEFEPIFIEDSPEVSFITKSMNGYINCLNEMRRRVNCEVCRKTKTRLLGHRYDSLNKSYIFIGKLFSRRSDKEASNFLIDISQMPEVYLYIDANNISEKDTIESVYLKNTIITGFSEKNNIIIEENPSLMIDSGQVLSGQPKFDQDTLESMVKLSIELGKQVNDYGVVYFKNLKDLFEPLNYLSIDYLNNQIDLTKFKDIYMDIIYEALYQKLLYFKDKNQYKLVNDTESDVETVISILFDRCIIDFNALSKSYYFELFKYIGFDLKEDIIKKLLVNWKKDNISNNFDKYIKYYEFLAPKELDAFLRTSTSLAYTRAIISISSLVGENELRDIIVSIINNADNSFGLGVDFYHEYDSGTRNNPKRYTSIKITLKNIIDFVGGVDKLNTNLKKLISSINFSYIKVDYDKGSILN